MSNKKTSTKTANRSAGGGCGCSVEIVVKARGDAHIHTCGEHTGDGNGPCPDHDCDCPSRDCPPGACLPTVAGAKHKKSRNQRLAALAAGTPLPSSLASGGLQLCRRFMAGQDPANDLEEDAFALLDKTTPAMREVLSCALDALDELPPEQRGGLVDPKILADVTQPLTPGILTDAWTEEVFGRVSDELFGDTEGLKAEVPGKIRIFVPNDDVFPSPVRVCRLNDLRTAHFRPGLSGGDYLPAEIEQVCEVQIVDGVPQVSCQVQTDNCPGNSAAGVCLRVPEIAAGDTVLLEGVNFFSTDAIVRLTSNEPTNPTTVDVDTHIRGDLVTPVTEIIDGQVSLIMDCRVHDRLLFQVPEDLPPATYSVSVIVPNITGIDFWGESLSSEPEYITVVPPPTTRFTVTSETLHAEDETSPSWAGSDEVGLQFLVAAVLADGSPLLSEKRPPVRLGDVDSGDTRDITRLIFDQQQPITALLLSVVGHEVDSEDAYEKMITDWTDVFVDLVKAQIKAIAAAVSAAGGLKALGKLPPWAWWAIGIAIVVTLAIDFFVALWAPADLIIEDSIGLGVVELSQLTSPDFPAPPDLAYTSAGGIDVERKSLEKLPTQYREERSYHSDDEDSTYQLTLRFNRKL